MLALASLMTNNDRFRIVKAFDLQMILIASRAIVICRVFQHHTFSAMSKGAIHGPSEMIRTLASHMLQNFCPRISVECN